jgi:uncharacterized protein DUF4435
MTPPRTLKETLSSIDAVGSVRLSFFTPQGKDKVYVLVEGPDDIKLFRKIFCKKNVSVQDVPGSSKIDLIKALEKIQSVTTKVIGINDADFRRIKNALPTNPSHFLSDGHDTEMMLIQSDETFNAVLCELGLSIDSISDLRLSIINSLLFLSGVRYWNEADAGTESKGINFEGINMRIFFDGSDLDASLLVQELHARSRNSKDEINQQNIESLIKGFENNFDFCNGHDFHKALDIIIRKKCNEKPGPKNLEADFRKSYHFSDFTKTNLYADLSNWANQTKNTLFAQG